jgi:hypothetical protein
VLLLLTLVVLVGDGVLLAAEESKQATLFAAGFLPELGAFQVNHNYTGVVRGVALERNVDQALCNLQCARVGVCVYVCVCVRG